jgi:L-asparagine transporter-like permease
MAERRWRSTVGCGRVGLALRPGFVADKSIDFSNLWAHGGFLPYGVARSPSGADSVDQRI